MIEWLLPCRLCSRWFCRKWGRLCVWCIAWRRMNDDSGERAFAHFGRHDDDVIPRREP